MSGSEEEKISPAEWVSVAIKRISQIALQNGEKNVNKTFSGSGSELQNFLGFAFGIPYNTVDCGKKLSPTEEAYITYGLLPLYKGSALENIKKIIDAMYDKSSKYLEISILILPMMYYEESERKMTQLTVIKFKVEFQNDCYYIDFMGRVYKTFDRFLSGNKLPNGTICYPRNGEFIIEGDNVKCGLSNCGSILSILDSGIGLLGIAGSIGATFATGGMAAPLLYVSIGSAAYSTGRGIATLFDRAEHRQSINPFTDRHARVVWLSVSANIVSVSALAVRSAQMRNFTKTSKAFQTKSTGYSTTAEFLRYSAVMINGISVLDEIFFVIDQWNLLETNEKIMVTASICFHVRCAISFANADKIITIAKENIVMSAFSSSNTDDYGVVSAIKKLFLTEQGYRMAKDILKRNIKVETDPENYTFIFFEKFKVKIQNLLGFKEKKDESTLFDIVCSLVSSGLALANLVFIFFNGDVEFIKAAAKLKQDKQVSWINIFNIFNELVSFLKLLDYSRMTIQNLQMRIGRGVFLTTGEAYAILKTCGISGAKKVFSAFTNLSIDDCLEFNSVVKKYGIQSTLLFLSKLNKDDAIEIMISGHKKGLLKYPHLITERTIFEILSEMSDSEVTSFITLIKSVNIEIVIDAAKNANDQKIALQKLSSVLSIGWCNPTDLVHIFSTNEALFECLLSLTSQERKIVEAINEKIGIGQITDYVKHTSNMNTSLKTLIKGYENGLLDCPHIITEKNIFAMLLELSDLEIKSFLSLISHIDSKTIFDAIKSDNNHKRAIRNLIKLAKCSPQKSQQNILSLFSTEKNIFTTLVNLSVEDQILFDKVVHHNNYNNFDEVLACIKNKNKKFENEAIYNLIYVTKIGFLYDRYNTKKYLRLLPEGGVLFKSLNYRYRYREIPSPNFAIKLHALKDLDVAQREKFSNSTFIETCIVFNKDKHKIIKSIWINSFRLKDEFLLIILSQLEGFLSDFNPHRCHQRVTRIFDFVFRMNPNNIIEFYYYAKFADFHIKRMNGEPNIDILVQNYCTLRNQVTSLKMIGFEKLDSSLLNDSSLFESIQKIAVEGKLKFGYVGNAVLHLSTQPHLRLPNGLNIINNILGLKEFHYSRLEEKFSDTKTLKLQTKQGNINFEMVVSKTGKVYILNFYK